MFISISDMDRARIWGGPRNAGARIPGDCAGGGSCGGIICGDICCGLGKHLAQPRQLGPHPSSPFM